MADSLHTVVMHSLIDRWRAGDLAARDELVSRVVVRLERLARKMMTKFPRVRQWVELEDVLQAALMRLLRALEELRPQSTRDFFGLAAEQVRRELLDLARHFYGPHGLGTHHAGRVGRADSVSPGTEPTDPAPAADDLDRWCAFHEYVERLPVEEREVIGLVYYHGWTQADVAQLFGVSDRTVRRWWEKAMASLRERLAG